MKTKADQIATLSERELIGWIWGRTITNRPAEPGENSAILKRAALLGITVQSTYAALPQQDAIKRG